MIDDALIAALKETEARDLPVIKATLSERHSSAIIDAVMFGDQDTERSKGDDDPGLIKRLADEIQETDYFALDLGGLLYVYVGGVYKRGGERHIHRRVKALLIEWSMTNKWSSYRGGQVVEYIRIDAPVLWDNPPADTLNCLNGLLDVFSLLLQDHDPAFLSPVQIPVAYDLAAVCPAWDQFCKQTFPQDAVEADVPYEIAASILTPHTATQKAGLFLGEGANGKSTFLAALTSLIGRQNVSNVSLHRLESNRFSVGRLVGKLANICPDLPSEDLADTSIFKALTGDDRLTGEYKFKDAFEFTPFARLLFSANNPPRSNDATHAFFRRWYTVPFCRTFEEGDQTPRAKLDAQLAMPCELSGALNKALSVLPRVRASGITETKSMKEAWEDFRQTTDPLSVWLDRETEELSEAVISKHVLRLAYNDRARAASNPVLSDQAFGRALKRLRPRVLEGQRVWDGKERTHCWLGIRLCAGDEVCPGNGRNGSNGFSATVDNHKEYYASSSVIKSEKAVTSVTSVTAISERLMREGASRGWPSISWLTPNDASEGWAEGEIAWRNSIRRADEAEKLSALTALLQDG